MQSRKLLFAVTALVLTACPEDMTDEKTTWATTTAGWTARMEKMKKGHEELAGKVKAFVVPESEAELAAEKAALDKSVETGSTAITAAEHEMSTAKTTMDGLFEAGKKVRVEVALGTTKSTVDGTLSRAESLISAANSGLETLEKKVAAAKATGDAMKARTDAFTAEVKKKGATVTLDDVSFAGEAIDLEKSKVPLASLAAALKTCGELKVDLTVMARGEAADLGTKRADALKSYLTGAGVNAAALGKITGTVAAEGDETVAVLVATPCK